jgi:hypothetical protein
MSGNLVNKQQSPTSIRVLGGILIFLGVILVGSMAAIMMWINNIIANSGKTGSTVKWNAAPQQQQMTFLILGAVAAFGVSAMLTGLLQIITGKRNRMMVGLMIGLWIVLMILAWAIRMFF